MSTYAFRDQYTECGGTKLRFEGNSIFKGKNACSLYLEDFGCSVHEARPLACRLFPLGRQIQNNEAEYIFQGEQFPCIINCPDVSLAPKLSVRTYLKGQVTEHFETAQDAYLELMQNLADIAFELFLDTGLAQSGDTKTLSCWKTMGSESPEILAHRIGSDWMDALQVPKISETYTDSLAFVEQHNEMLQIKIQETLGNLETNSEFHINSVLLMGLALHLARSIGANPATLATHWCEAAEGFRG